MRTRPRVRLNDQLDTVVDRTRTHSGWSVIRPVFLSLQNAKSERTLICVLLAKHAEVLPCRHGIFRDLRD